MSDDQKRSADRESFFLISTVRLTSGEQRVKVRNLSPSGALVEGIKFASAGAHGWMDIRNVGDVGFSIAWASEGRAGLKFDRTIDPILARGTSATTLDQQEIAALQASVRPARASLRAGPFYVVRWMKGAELISETRFDHLLEAKTHAKDRLAINRIRKGVTAVEVCDIEGVEYFYFDA